MSDNEAKIKLAKSVYPVLENQNIEKIKTHKLTKAKSEDTEQITYGNLFYYFLNNEISSLYKMDKFWKRLNTKHAKNFEFEHVTNIQVNSDDAYFTFSTTTTTKDLTYYLSLPVKTILGKPYIYVITPTGSLVEVGYSHMWDPRLDPTYMVFYKDILAPNHVEKESYVQRVYNGGL